MTDSSMTPEEYSEAVGFLGAIVIKAKILVDAVSRDDNGIMVAGQWRASNGGMLSRETIAAADALRRELENWKAR